MSRLRVFVSNGGKVYEELIKKRKINTKLKRYDKIIKRNIKKKKTELRELRIPLIDSGIKTETREILKKVVYG